MLLVTVARIVLLAPMVTLVTRPVRWHRRVQCAPTRIGPHVVANVVAVLEHVHASPIRLVLVPMNLLALAIQQHVQPTQQRQQEYGQIGVYVPDYAVVELKPDDVQQQLVLNPIHVPVNVLWFVILLLVLLLVHLPIVLHLPLVAHGFHLPSLEIVN